MLKFKKALSLFICISVLLLASCSGNITKNEEPDYPVPVFDVSASEDGILYRNYMNRSLLYYFDFETKTAIPFCAQPNCMHDTEDCPANNHYDEYLIIDKKLYAFEQTAVKKVSDEISFDQSNIIIADIGGTNKRVLATFDGTLMFSGAPPRDTNIYYYNDCIYFVSSSSEIRDYMSTNYRIWYAYCYNIKNNTLTKLGELCKGYFANVRVLGMTKEKLYFHAFYTDKDLNYNDYINEDDFFDELQKLLKEEFSYLDLQTCEVYDNDLPNINPELRIFAGYYFYNNDNGEFIALDLDNCAEIRVLDKTCSHYYWAGDRLVFYVDGPSNEDDPVNEQKPALYYWLPKANKVQQLPLRTDGIIFTPFIMKDGYFYGEATYPEEPGLPYISYAKINDLTEQDYEITKVE